MDRHGPSDNRPVLTIAIGTARRCIRGKPGLWLEQKSLARDDAFAEALARGFARFLAPDKVNASAIAEPMLRKRVAHARPGG